MRKPLIAMPKSVFLTVRPFAKTVQAAASGPGPAATILVLPMTLAAQFKLPLVLVGDVRCQLCWEGLSS